MRLFLWLLGTFLLLLLALTVPVEGNSITFFFIISLSVLGNTEGVIFNILFLIDS